jgi:hypothetical protein
MMNRTTRARLIPRPEPLEARTLLAVNVTLGDDGILLANSLRGSLFGSWGR